MKKVIFTLFFLIFFSNFLNASNYSSNPEQFVSELVNDAISKLANKEITDEQLKYKKISFNRWKNYVRVQQSNTK